MGPEQAALASAGHRWLPAGFLTTLMLLVLLKGCLLSQASGEHLELVLRVCCPSKNVCGAGGSKVLLWVMWSVSGRGLCCLALWDWEHEGTWPGRGGGPGAPGPGVKAHGFSPDRMSLQKRVSPAGFSVKHIGHRLQVV